MVRRLNAIPGVRCELPVGGYFLWVDFSALAQTFAAHGHTTVDQFLLHEARVAVISGGHFAEGTDEFRHFARLNCGRSLASLTQACARIAFAVSWQGPAQPDRAAPPKGGAKGEREAAA